MTSTDLERVAASLIPPVGTTGVTLDVDHEPGERLRNGSPAGIGGRTRYRIAWLVGGRRRLPDGPAFDRARDARRLMDLLAGAPAPRPAPIFPADGPTAPPAGPQRGRTGAPAVEAIPRTRGIEPATTPDPAQQADVGRPARSCVRCGRPLPPGSRSQRRTCSGACREGARYRRAANGGAAAADTADGVLTVSGRLGAIHPGQVPSARESAVRPTAAPVCRAGARGTKRSRRARAAHAFPSG